MVTSCVKCKGFYWGEGDIGEEREILVYSKILMVKSRETEMSGCPLVRGRF